ncbi:hypothetical protein PM082_015445 [Marasmius tenuissimus]|nr:hypothetical protein PM082_015445 [Marasmius tenuissimus]
MTRQIESNLGISTTAYTKHDSDELNLHLRSQWGCQIRRGWREIRLYAHGWAYQWRTKTREFLVLFGSQDDVFGFGGVRRCRELRNVTVPTQWLSLTSIQVEECVIF